jgi:cytochrome oxidase Cu insertion factor (SCO1/SenC/PrrC family)
MNSDPLTSFDPKRVRRSRIILILIVGTFMLPFLAALWVTSDLERFFPGEYVHGELIKPARELTPFSLPTSVEPITLEQLKGHWTILYVTNVNCDERCRQNIHLQRQVHVALGAEQGRVQRLTLLSKDAASDLGVELALSYPKLQLAVAHESFLRQLGKLDDSAPEYDKFYYVIDPLGYLMLRYPVSENQKGFLKDLKKLLKLSRIG